MVELKKVKECYNNSAMYLCERCEIYTDNKGWYCSCCNPRQEVDFEVDEFEEQWKGKYVCPYCYNQLIDRKLVLIELNKSLMSIVSGKQHEEGL